MWHRTYLNYQRPWQERDTRCTCLQGEGTLIAYDCINGVNYQRVNSDSAGDLIYQMDSMCDALYDRFLAVQKIFGKFDIMHGHDWHPVPALNA